MNKIKYVGLNRAEGPVEECGAVVFYIGNKPVEISEKGHFKDAKFIEASQESIKDDILKQIRKWSYSAPENGCYDKTDFLVVWEDDMEYEGRFDMRRDGTDAGEGFWDSLKGRLEFYACQKRPVHFKDDHWQNHIKMMTDNGGKEECAKMLSGCEL